MEKKKDLKTQKSKIKDIEVNKKEVRDAIAISSRILKIFYILVLVLGVYVLTLIFKEWNVLGGILSFFKILSPFFIGIVIAWLLDPLVKKLTNKGLNRILATILVFLGFILILVLIVIAILPMFWNQINDFVNTIPNVIEQIKNWLDGFFGRLATSDIYDFEAVRQEVYAAIQGIGGNIAVTLPEVVVNTVGGIVSGFGVFVIGLLIGFYMLFDFSGISKGLLKIIPKAWRNDFEGLMDSVNTSLRSYVHGIFIVSSIIFVCTSIAFWAIGLEAPLLFGFICGITNVIPYVGPYIGGAPAAIVAFTQSPATGILAIILMFVIQFIEGNILQPLIMGKTMKLHPVAIILGLLIFGSLFGIVGMILATPIIAIGKILIIYLDEKFDIIKWISFKDKI